MALAVQVGYDTDLDLAMRLMKDGAAATAEAADPEPGALLLDFADSGINLEVGFWVADPENGTGGVRSDIGRAILQAFRTHGIEIPFRNANCACALLVTVELPGLEQAGLAAPRSRGQVRRMSRPPSRP